MSLASVTLTVNEALKTMTASAPFALRESVPVSVTPSAVASGTTVLTLTRLGSPVAEATLTSGSGTIDLSTAEAVALFTGLPASACIFIDAELWSSDSDRLVAKARLRLQNVLESSRSSVRIAAAGELSMTLAATLAAGRPVMRDDAGKAAACRAANAHRFLGILRTGGSANASVRVVTAGLVAVTGWALTPGACYYLSTSADTLTSTAPDGYNVRPVGIAIDSSTLCLIPQPTIQTVSSGAHYITWEAAYRRFIALSPAVTSSGAADASRIPALDATGKLDASMMPDQTAASVAAVRALFSSVQTLENPTVGDIVTALNQLITILKGA